jgi:hypothetical protein
MRILVNLITAGTLLAAATLAQAGCFRCEPIQNVIDQGVVSASSKSLTQDQVRASILRAGAALGWQMKETGPGKLAATINLRKHQAEVEIPYSATSFSIIYKNSSNLDAADGQIHKNYNGWIQNLSKGISAQLATAGA